MIPSDRRLLLASIHDVSPRFESEIDRLSELLHPHVGDRLAMLVVPNHWGEAPLVAGSAFGTKLRSWADRGIEMFLHGYFHRDDGRRVGGTDRLRARFMTANEGEFMALSREEAGRRIADGRKLVEDMIGRPIAGFVAPAWLYGEGALEAIAEAGMLIAEDHFHVWSPVSGRQLARGPVVTWASRTRMRLASSLLAAAALRRFSPAVMRIGVHPPDIRHPALVRSIEKTFAAAARKRRPGRYADLLTERRRDFQ